jgi:hypothetical protein
MDRVTQEEKVLKSQKIEAERYKMEFVKPVVGALLHLYSTETSLYR